MYRRRSTLLTFHFLRPFTTTKVCNTNNLNFCRTLSTTALQYPDNLSQTNTQTEPNDFQPNQYGYGNGDLGHAQNSTNQFHHNQNHNLGNAYIGNAQINGEKGNLSGGYVDHGQRNGGFGGYNGSSGYAGDMQQKGYGRGGLGSGNGGFDRGSSGGYSGGGNLQPGWGRSNYENTQHSGLKPENSQQSFNAGNARPGNLQQGWNAGYSGGNSQQSWNIDHSARSSGNSQHGWGDSGHPPQNWNVNNTQNAGMHQEISHGNYAGGTLQFGQGNYNSNHSGVYHGNTGFSNNHGNVTGYQQTGGGHQSDAGFPQQTFNQYERGYVGTLGQSNVIPNEVSEVVEEDQLKGTMEELDKFYQQRKLKEAVDVLGLLEGQRIAVDLERYLLLFKACGEEEALEEGKSIHKHLLRSGLHLDVKTFNVILKMYCSCGSLDDAFEVFDKMLNRNLTTWDTMISWLAKNGHGEEAISTFTQFKETGLKPDGRMFLGVFSACGVLGDTVEGLLHFESMKKDFSIVPSMEHYISVVDMLGTAGNLDEALEFIEKMPLEPTIEVWEVLMNLCRMHGNLELGDRCAELVESLDPSRLDEQSRAGYLPLKLSDLAKEKEKKKSGQIFPEGRSRVHEYRAGDKSQPELYELLRGMRQQLKEAGYIPEVKFVLHDIDQEGKEEALMAHSERLAVAQGLLTSPARNPIRIIKNLRICVDCHTTMKIVSKLVGRELIIRDAKRFHHFKDGLCSCRDYW